MATPEAAVSKIYEAFSAGNLPGILDQLTDDVTWSVAGTAPIPYCGMFTGKEGAQRFFASKLETSDCTAFKLTEVYPCGDVIFAEGEVSYKVKATGKSFDSKWIHVWKFRGNLAHAFEIHYDTARAVAAYTA